MTDDQATLTAFLVAPVVPAVAFALSSPGLGGGSGADPVTLAMLSMLAYVYALAAVGVLGVPAFLVLRRFGLHGPVSATVSAALIAALVGLGLAPRPGYLSTLEWLWSMRLFVPVGGATGFVFWTVRSLCLRREVRRG
jgi:hypothetical protein